MLHLEPVKFWKMLCSAWRIIKMKIWTQLWKRAPNCSMLRDKP